MSEILSQNEIDALLSAVSAGDVGKDGGDHGNLDWVAYDLASQEKFLRGRLIALEGIHERFCRLFRLTLLNTLKKTAGVTYKSTEIIRFGEYLNSVVLPASLNVISMRNPAGYMLLVLGSKLVYALVDAYYGGNERPFSKIGNREDFTKIEKNLVQKVVGGAVTDLREAWKLNYPLDLTYVTTEANPHFMGYIHTSESVAIVNFDVEFESLAGSMALVLQLRAFDSIRKFLSVNVTREISTDADIWRRHLSNELSAIELDVSVLLGEAKATLREVLEWKPGDTIVLAQDAVSPLKVCVEGIPKFQGQMGVCRGSTAVRILES